MGLDADIYRLEKKYIKNIEDCDYVGDLPNEEIQYWRKFYELDAVVHEECERLEDDEFIITKDQLNTLLEKVKAKAPHSYDYTYKVKALEETIEKLKQTDFDKYFILYSRSA